MTKFPVNLDANASHPVLPKIWQALSAVRPQLNPSSIHMGGQQARALVEDARESVRKLLGLDKSWKLVFTSGASEANNCALLAPLWNWLERREACAPHVLSSALEHPSVREPLYRLSKMGIHHTEVFPKRESELSINDFIEKVEADTALVSCMLANNETGQIFPVAEIAAKVKELRPNALVHCDAVQALGKMRVNFADLGVDIFTFSSHKIGGLAGAGVLALRAGVACKPLILGGSQEGRMRAGTENISAIYALGLAAQEVTNSLDSRISQMASNANLIKAELKRKIKNISFNFENQNTLCNTLSVSIDGINGDDLVVAADLAGVYISAGSACSSGKPEPSGALIAQGFSVERAKSTIRISVSAELLSDDAERAADILARCVERAREINS